MAASIPAIAVVSYARGPLAFSPVPADPVRGALLRALRETAGLSLLDGAEAIGCTPSGLSSLERAWRNVTDDEWLRVAWLINRARKVGAK